MNALMSLPLRAPRTFATVCLFALVAVAATAGSAGGAASGVGFKSAPFRVVQGNVVTVTVAVSPAGAPCFLNVGYADGSRQGGLGTRRALGGLATWRWRIPRTVRPGPANVTVSCLGAGSATRRMMVIGQLLPLKISVVKKGFSVRNLPYGGTRVSYGVILRNESKVENAQNATVLVNFVMSDNRLIGSASTGLMEVRANTEHVLGGDLTFPGGAPIERLEVVVQVAARGPATRRAPGITAVRVVPDLYEPEWVGSVEGELANDDLGVTMQFARMSAVVLDADGNVLGGAGGFANASLPPGTRQFFKLSGSLNAIPFGYAASALVSVEPMYARA